MHTTRYQCKYTEPYAWHALLAFLNARKISSLEWGDEHYYARTIQLTEQITDPITDPATNPATNKVGYLEARQDKQQQALIIDVHWLDDRPLNAAQNAWLQQHLAKMFDTHAPINTIDQHLGGLFGEHYCYGLRIPGIWQPFEAGLRAILGQQISVGAARNLVIALVENLGEPINVDPALTTRLFPTPQAVLNSDLGFFRMPQARKDTCRALAQYLLDNPHEQTVDAWLDIKGIGAWTLNYVKMRSVKDPDIWLAGDAGLKNALKIINPDINHASPWRSYLTLQLWQQLHNYSTNPIDKTQ